MPKLYSSRVIETVLLRLNFKIVSQKGSHGKFKNPEGHIVILPMNRKEIPQGTFRSILRQAGISESKFKTLLK